MAKVLIVDDDTEIVSLLREVLIHDGHAVESAGNCSDGARKMEELRPDIAFLDVHMPGETGFHLLWRVKATDWGNTIKVIMMGGDPDEMKQLIAENGFEGLIWKSAEKPIHLEDLRRLIREATGAPKP